MYLNPTTFPSSHESGCIIGNCPLSNVIQLVQNVDAIKLIFKLCFLYFAHVMEMRCCIWKLLLYIGLDEQWLLCWPVTWVLANHGNSYMSISYCTYSVHFLWPFAWWNICNLLTNCLYFRDHILYQIKGNADLYYSSYSFISHFPLIPVDWEYIKYYFS